MYRPLLWMTAATLLAVCAVARGADKTALTQRLRHAAESSSIDDPALKPWHLRLTFQLFNEKAVQTEEGTIEEWWSAGNYKRVYISPSYTATEIKREKDIFRTSGQPSAPYLLDLLRNEVVHPLADNGELDDSVPDLRVESFGKTKLDCIMLDHPIKNVAFPPLGLFPTYCLDRDQDRLRISFRYASEHLIRNSIATFQGRGIPVDTIVSVNGVTSAKGHLAALVGSTPPDHFFDPDGNLQLQNGEALRVGAGVIAGAKIGGVVPVYPEVDKRNHTSGAVHLHAVIGTDGRIHQLSIMDTPSPTLAISALTAVRQWVYKPYLLNRLPCSVDTTITVNYNFGPD